MELSRQQDAIAGPLLLLCLSLLSTGCAGNPASAPLIERQTARAETDAMVRDAQAELAAMRRELAAARIATSKQEAETVELRRKLAALEADRSELQQMLEQAHATASTLQRERDDLKQTLLQSPQAVATRQDTQPTSQRETADTRADMKELAARLAALTNELGQLKQRWSNTARTTAGNTSSASSLGEKRIHDESGRVPIMSSAIPLNHNEVTIQTSGASDSSETQQYVRVQPGDSLWRIAREHGTTVEELKRVNGLTADAVQLGQRLILPLAAPADQPHGRQ